MTHQHDRTPSHCIIGAGFSGLPIAKRLAELGESFEILEKHDGVGGIWHQGAYDTAHIISSKLTTQFPDFPMPKEYPDFPSRNQMSDYFKTYANYFGLTPHIQFHTPVARVRPAPDYAETRNWIVQLDSGEERVYQSVIVATGHHSQPRDVAYPGAFTGQIIHSNQYRNPELFRGKRVLVVGYGNTGCDAAVDAARVGANVAISMRNGAYFFPKTFMGVPLAELGMNLPVRNDLIDRLVGRLVLAFAVGDLRRYGVLQPTDRPYDKHPIVNTELLNQVRHGKIQVRPGIARFDGTRVQFVDGTIEEYDLIFYAVGYKIDYPMLHPVDNLLDWDGDLPILHTQMMAPKWRGLFFAGLGQARTGGGPLFQVGGYLLARMAAFDAHSPIGIMAAINQHPSTRFATRVFGYHSVQPANVRSYGVGYYQRTLPQFTQLLDAIGCPDAPARISPGAPSSPFEPRAGRVVVPSYEQAQAKAA
jgi:cation diffusion facilitator CzcD-associated flavoprotein CzcO